MSNWKERAEQEKLRLAREQESSRQAKNQAETDKEALIRERLGLFDELGIRRMLAEIQRDIGRGQGSISDELFVRNELYGFSEEAGLAIIKKLGVYKSDRDFSDSTEKAIRYGLGIKSSILSGTTWRVDVKKEPVWKRVFGAYETEVGRSMEGVPSLEMRRGWHNIIIGDKIVDAGLVSTTRDYLSPSLIYFAGPNRYLLVVGRKAMGFSTPDSDELDKFLDQAFLDYATNVGIPDFNASRREAEAEAARIKSRIGEIIR